MAKFLKQKVYLRQREIDYNVTLPHNIPPLLRRIYASRGVNSAIDLERSIDRILPWQQLNGIRKATDILYQAFCTNMSIVVIGDFDVDGATSTALSVLCLRELGCNNVSYLIPNRFKNGYGLSPEIVDQVYAQGSQIIITVDNGILSNAGVEHANRLGIIVLITDHHLPGTVLPNAEAIINPNLNCCNFPSKSLAGVGVAFYLMLALREFLYKKNWFNYRCIAMPNLAKYLDLVALGTVADAVPLDTNNRILIWQGLKRMRVGKCCPGIKALIKIAKCNVRTLMASDLGFIIAPRLNAAGRLDDMSISVMLLLCNNFKEAYILANKLNALNKTRKKIEQVMLKEALNLYENLELNITELSNSIIMYHHKWHQGLIGILASRLKEYFYRPVIIFALANDGTLRGSGRSIYGLHMLDLLEHINTLNPGLIINFGGHGMAVGLSLEKDKLNEFKYYFNKVLNRFLDPLLLRNEIVSDGQLLPTEMTIEMAQIICDAGPWGQMFPEPLFNGRFYFLKQDIVANHHLKVIVKPFNGGPLLNGIYFNIDKTLWPDNSVHEAELIYKLHIDEFHGNRKLQIIINNIWLLYS